MITVSGDGVGGGDADGDDRGVSEVVGIVLLFGLVTVGIGILFLSGTALQDQINDQTRLRTMEVTMSELDSKLSTLVYRQDVNLTSLDLPTPQDRGRMEVREGVSAVSVSLNGKRGCTHSVEMGTIAYVDPSGTELVYEAGAIWKVPSDEAGAAVPSRVLQVQQPSLQYDGVNVSMTVPKVEGEFATSGGIEAVKDVNRSVHRSEEMEYQALFNNVTDDECWRLNRSDAPAVHSPGGVAPVVLPERVRLYINVTSPYHAAWERHLEREFSTDLRSARGEVYDRDPNDQRVGVVLYYEDLGGFDHDDDGIPNRRDNCPTRYNPSQQNSEPSGAPGDPFGDECDPDDDGDGVPDDPVDPDNADYGEISSRPDVDNRGQPYYNYTDNWTDVGPGNADDTLGNLNDNDAEYSTDDYPGKDPGNDAVPGSGRPAGDNCQKEQNPSQLNWDGDTVGNKCEDESALRDLDGDGVPLSRDTCPIKDGFNPPRPEADWVVNASESDEKLTDQPNADHEEELNDPLAYPGPQASGDACDPDDDNDTVLDPWNPAAALNPNGNFGDNCPRRKNPAQENTDVAVGDWTGRGDVCDRDIDNDGYTNPLGLDGPTPTPNGSLVDECPYLGTHAGPTNSENASHPGCPDRWQQMKAGGTHRAPNTASEPGPDDDKRNWNGFPGDDYWRNPPPSYDNTTPYSVNRPGGPGNANWTDDHPPGTITLRCDSADTPDTPPSEYPDPGDAWRMFMDPAYDLDGDGIGPCYPSPPVEYDEPGEGRIGTSAINFKIVVFELDADEDS